MAQGSKGAARHAPSAPNGSTPTTASASAVSSAPAPAPAVNRKKQKRRQKQAAKDAAGAGQQPPPSDHPHHHDRQSAPHYQEYDDDDSEYAYGTYAGSPGRVNGHVNGHASAADTAKKPKKKKGKPADPHPLAASARPSTEDVWSPAKDDDSKQIKDFWLQLTDAERKSLLALEKDAVLKAMRETSQRQTCGCAICGRRRGAIEAELEYLYAQYFNDLVQYVCIASSFSWANLFAVPTQACPTASPPPSPTDATTKTTRTTKATSAAKTATETPAGAPRGTAWRPRCSTWAKISPSKACPSKLPCRG
jgi:hypothetical protein